jgi:hypothetical protein
MERLYSTALVYLCKKSNYCKYPLLPVGLVNRYQRLHPEACTYLLVGRYLGRYHEHRAYRVYISTVVAVTIFPLGHAMECLNCIDAAEARGK